MPLGGEAVSRLKVRTRHPVLRGAAAAAAVPGRLRARRRRRRLPGPCRPRRHPGRPVVDGAFNQKPILTRMVVAAAAFVLLAGIGAAAYAGTRHGNESAGDVESNPFTPTGFEALDNVSPKVVTLTWDAMKRVDGYRLYYYHRDTGKFESPDDVGKGSTVNAALPPETYMCFQLTAYRGKFESERTSVSDEACGETEPAGTKEIPAPGVPSPSVSVTPDVDGGAGGGPDPTAARPHRTHRTRQTPTGSPAPGLHRTPPHPAPPHPAANPAPGTTAAPATTAPGTAAPRHPPHPTPHPPGRPRRTAARLHQLRGRGLTRRHRGGTRAHAPAAVRRGWGAGQGAADAELRPEQGGSVGVAAGHGRRHPTGRPVGRLPGWRDGDASGQRVPEGTFDAGRRGRDSCPRPMCRSDVPGRLAPRAGLALRGRDPLSAPLVRTGGRPSHCGRERTMSLRIETGPSSLGFLASNTEAMEILSAVTG